MATIKNIIFDLGGVLLNIGYDKTSAAFRDLGIENFDELFSQFKSNDLFEKLETGKISEENFYKAVLQYSPIALKKNEIETAWNAMLLDFRIKSLDFLETISSKYNLFLLSNTNSIHHKAFLEILKNETGKLTLDTYFKRSYYSHVMGMRKPYTETYQFVLNNCNIIAEETLFIDDSINNIEGAKETGIVTHHLLAWENIENLGL
jgi:HAD superfamily hydrolase (TIGR01509 family)